MKKITVVLGGIILAVLLSLSLGTDGTAYGQLTPTVPLYMPYIVNAPPTPTFTRTPTATATVPAPTNTPTPTRTPTRTPTSPAPANVRITYILYDPPSGTLEEYVRIQNLGGTAQNMTSWTLRDASAHVYTFPAFTLAVGAQVQVWTKSGTNNSTNLYWGSAQAIWNNTGDTAQLRNAGGTIISECSYGGGGQGTNCP